MMSALPITAEPSDAPDFAELPVFEISALPVTTGPFELSVFLNTDGDIRALPAFTFTADAVSEFAGVL